MYPIICFWYSLCYSFSVHYYFFNLNKLKKTICSDNYHYYNTYIYTICLLIILFTMFKQNTWIHHCKLDQRVRYDIILLRKITNFLYTLSLLDKQYWMHIHVRIFPRFRRCLFKRNKLSRKNKNKIEPTLPFSRFLLFFSKYPIMLCLSIHWSFSLSFFLIVQWKKRFIITVDLQCFTLILRSFSSAFRCSAS